ncbi:MAG: hypothetical protein EOP04_24780, partial [Proteobacteria bacterium]
MDNLSFEAQQIISQKTKDWEYRLFSQVLRDELAQYSERREIHRADLPVFPKETIPKHKVSGVIGEQMLQQAESISAGTKTRDFLANSAFGQSGAGHDEYFMVQLAVEIAASYKESLDLALWWRSLLVPNPLIYQAFFREASLYEEVFLHSVETLPDRIEEQLEAYKDASEDEIVPIFITIDMTPHNLEAYEREGNKM